MLKGTVKIGGYTYLLNGYDYGDAMPFYLSSPLIEGVRFLDKGNIFKIDGDEDLVFPATWEKIHFSVGVGFIKVSCFTERAGEDVVKNTINSQAFSRIGSILRGMKSICNNTNRDDMMDMMIGEFIPKKTIHYVMGDKGFVDLYMGAIVSFNYKDEEIEIELEDEKGYYEKVVGLTNTNHKLKLDLSEFTQDEDEDSWGNIYLDEDSLFSIKDIIERNPDKSYGWINDQKYSVVSDIEEVEKICKLIWKHNGVVAFDTETTGLNFTVKCLTGEGDRLVGMVFSIKEGEAWYFPVAHKHIKNICNSGNEKYIIEKLFKPLLEKKDLLCHNGAFDWKVMYPYGISINLVHDTYIMFKVTLWNDHRNMGLGLKDLAKMFLDRDSLELKDFVKGKWGENNVKFWDLDEESTKFYACPDTDSDLTLLNWALKENILGQYGAEKTYSIEVPFSIVIAYQEFYGHCADVDKVEDLVKDIKDVKEKEYKAMVDICGHDFNPRSNLELPVILYDELKYPVYGYTATGNRSTDKNCRKQLMSYLDSDENPVYPFAHHLHNYLASAQLESNFTKNFDKFSTEDGFMFSSVQQFLETGRVSTKNPNYQSYNDTVKKYIVPREGYYALDADYSSIEYRILACMANQGNLIKEFYDPDMDYHTYQASRMFNVPYELVSKPLRQSAKGINFGIPYGMGDWKLGGRLYGECSEVNKEKAKRMKRLYFTGQENIEKFFVVARADGVKNSFSTTFFGRRRYFDKGKKDNASIEREAGNNRIQGTAADIYKIAMITLFTEIKKRDYLGKILISAFVHDEGLFEIHKSIDPCKMLKLLRECMMLKIEGWCPLYIGAGFGTNWYDAKKTEIPIQVQEELVSEFGETGLDWWDGDTEKLYVWEVNRINDYKVKRITSYLKDEKNWNSVLKPTENSLAHDILDEIKRGNHINGVVHSDVDNSIKDMVDNLREFCRVFGLLEDFEKANILRPVHNEPKVEEEELNVDEINEEVDLGAIISSRVSSLGVCIDRGVGETKILFRYDKTNPTLMRLVRETIDRNPGDCKVMAIKNGEEFETGLTTSIKSYSLLLKLYLKSK